MIGFQEMFIQLYWKMGDKRMTAWILLLIAACLEVEADALIRWGLKSGRILDFVLGGLALLTYGVFVNLSKWDFSQLLGIYIVMFFVISQLTGYFLFDEPMTQGRLVGGFLIALGGVCIMVWK
jgi:multidrug transporter EmrE-like cation transporter